MVIESIASAMDRVITTPRSPVPDADEEFAQWADLVECEAELVGMATTVLGGGHITKGVIQRCTATLARTGENFSDWRDRLQQLAAALGE